MRRARVIAVRIAGLFAAAVVTANLLHRVVMPAAPPDPDTFPRGGDTFGSAVEGFTQHVVGVQDGWLELRTHIAPRAPGPPLHVHESFAETFRVESGTVHIDLPDGVKVLGAGQSHRIEPGVPHRPHNPTDEEAVVAGDAMTMPQSFAACLVQIYHFLDEAGGQVTPGLALRIGALDPMCDAVAPGVSGIARIGLSWLVLPFARAAGYANYYPELSLHPGGNTANRPD